MESLNRATARSVPARSSPVILVNGAHSPYPTTPHCNRTSTNALSAMVIDPFEIAKVPVSGISTDQALTSMICRSVLENTRIGSPHSDRSGSRRRTYKGGFDGLAENIFPCPGVWWPTRNPVPRSGSGWMVGFPCNWQPHHTRRPATRDLLLVGHPGSPQQGRVFSARHGSRRCAHRHSNARIRCPASPSATRPDDPSADVSAPSSRDHAP